MPNKRFQLAQEDGALTQARRQNLKDHPMSPQQAAKVICQAHTRTTTDGGRDFTVDWGIPPDFTVVDGDMYWEAWKILRQCRVSKVS
jgi:hypothetical protein